MSKQKHTEPGNARAGAPRRTFATNDVPAQGALRKGIRRRIERGDESSPPIPAKIATIDDPKE